MLPLNYFVLKISATFKESELKPCVPHLYGQRLVDLLQPPHVHVPGQIEPALLLERQPLGHVQVRLVMAHSQLLQQLRVSWGLAAAHRHPDLEHTRHSSAYEDTNTLIMINVSKVYQQISAWGYLLFNLSVFLSDERHKIITMNLVYRAFYILK